MTNELDHSNMYGIFARFAEQLREARDIGRDTEVPPEFSRISAIVNIGMGGSAIGGDLLRCYLSGTIDMPIAVNRDYRTPAFVDKDCLVIVSSYSGNTEETLSAYEDAKAKGAKLICITSGGKVGERATSDGWPLISIPTGLPPRTALGYLSIPVLIVLAKLGLIPDQGSVLDECVALIAELASRYTNGGPGSENLAQQVAGRLRGTLPVIYAASDGFEVVGFRWRGQLSENSKILAYSSCLPELNHNEIVGWGPLCSVRKEIQVVLLRDRSDHPRVQRRMDITTQIVSEHTSPPIELYSEGQSRLARILSLIYLGDWVSYYLAILNGVDPTPVENIDFLKESLQRE